MNLDPEVYQRVLLKIVVAVFLLNSQRFVVVVVVVFLN